MTEAFGIYALAGKATSFLAPFLMRPDGVIGTLPMTGGVAVGLFVGEAAQSDDITCMVPRYNGGSA